MTSLAPAPSRRVTDLPPEERPRERLVRHGAQALSSRELLALLLGSGVRGLSALEAAENLLGAGLRDLASRSLAEMEGIQGMGRAKATRVLAALELGARLASEGPTSAAAFHGERLRGAPGRTEDGQEPVGAVDGSGSGGGDPRLGRGRYPLFRSTDPCAGR